MRPLVLYIALCITTLLLLSIESLQAQMKDISALRARIPSLTDSTERVSVYARLGMLYTIRSLDSSYYFSARALDLAKRIKYRRGEAEALNVLGFYYIEKANPYLAYKYSNEALAIFEQEKLPGKVSELTMNIGVLLGREGKHEQALEQFEKAYKLSEAITQDSIRPLLLVNFAYARSFRSPNFAEVAPLFDEAERLANERGNVRFLLMARQARNAVRFHKGAAPADVIPEQYKVIEQAKASGYEYHTAMGYMELGNMYVSVSADSALRYYDLGIELAKRTGYEGLYYHTMAQAYETLKRLPVAQEKANEYGQRLLEMARQKELENQKEGMDFLQLTIKEKEVAIAEAKYELRRTWVLLLGLICLLALAAAFLIYRQYRHKRKLSIGLRLSNDKLEEQNQQLEENNLFNQKIISMLSHDLRQPFTSMMMMGEGGMVEEMSLEQLRYIFKEMRYSAQTSLQTMDGLLHWMKLHVIGLAYSPSAVNLKENFQEALAYNQSTVQQKAIDVMDFIPPTMELLAQAEMLLFINRNIINNALRHTPEGGQVMVTATAAERGEEVVVRFSDSGEGIPEAILPLLFTKDRLETVEGVGRSGLALIICYEMIGKMNGRIWAANNPEGGASFYYSLPVAQNKHAGAQLSGASRGVYTAS